MNETPEVQPLPYQRRSTLFKVLFVIFVVVLPLFIFYATGYRFDFSGETRNIVGTGGFYISASVDDVDMFLNDEPIRNLRVFRNAAYIQNLEEGIHRVHVQKEGLHTWVKELPVFPHIVTEAEAFNMPITPQIRIVSPWLTPALSSVVFVSTTTEQILPFASTTNVLYSTTSNATSSYSRNPEHVYLEALFASSTAEGRSLIDRVVDEVNTAFNFTSSQPTTTASKTVATTTKRASDVVLYEKNGEVYASWRGTESATPYYYCIDYSVASTTALKYGKHVQEAIKRSIAAATGIREIEQNKRRRVCRDEIRIDRKGQEFYAFDFLPGSADHVLMHLEDGLYVVEVDDRAWQNMQRLYPGDDLAIVLDGGQIFVKDGEFYLEVLTELEE